jgi:hypothetical protein
MNNFSSLESYLEHAGVKGMKWGQKKNVTTAGFSKAGILSGYKNKSGQRVSGTTVRLQKNIDLNKRVASGKSGKLDKLRFAAGITPIALARSKGSLKKAAQRKVDKGAAFQKKSNAGEAKVRTAILKFGSQVRVTDLNYKA